MAESGESRLSRWSRLKREAAAGEPVPDADQAPEARVQEEAPPAPVDEEPEVRVEDLPDIETLTYESDFTAFLKKGVPEELQRLALRKLWRSDPILANVDGLNDYDWDFNKGLGLSDAVKALTPEQGDKAPMPEKEEVMPGRGPDPFAQKRAEDTASRREAGEHQEADKASSEDASGARGVRKLSS